MNISFETKKEEPADRSDSSEKVLLHRGAALTRNSLVLYHNKLAFLSILLSLFLSSCVTCIYMSRVICEFL